MKASYTLALVVAGAMLVNTTPLRASEAGGRIELSFNKSRTYHPPLSSDAIKIGQKTSAQTNEQASSRFRDEVGDLLALQVRPEAVAQPATVYRARIELSAARPNNVVHSEAHPGIEYSGILVQAVGNNPLQLLNPFAPARYGDGEANTVRSVITGRAEGLKVLSVLF
jgi:hypothetical protein